MRDEQNTWLGTVLIVGSAVAYSLSGYFTRLITFDVWTILFWRGLFGGLFIAAFLAWRHRHEGWAAIRAMGLPGLWVTCSPPLRRSASSMPCASRRSPMS